MIQSQRARVGWLCELEFVRCVWGTITIHQCCTGTGLHKRLKVDTSREAQWDQAKTAHSSDPSEAQGQQSRTQNMHLETKLQSTSSDNIQQVPLWIKILYLIRGSILFIWWVKTILYTRHFQSLCSKFYDIINCSAWSYYTGSCSQIVRCRKSGLKNTKVE